jgi:hypothetical protein
MEYVRSLSLNAAMCMIQLLMALSPPWQVVFPNPDHGVLQFRSAALRMLLPNYVVYDIVKDGNCLFTAFSAALQTVGPCLSQAALRAICYGSLSTYQALQDYVGDVKLTLTNEHNRVTYSKLLHTVVSTQHVESLMRFFMSTNHYGIILDIARLAHCDDLNLIPLILASAYNPANPHERGRVLLVEYGLQIATLQHRHTRLRFVMLLYISGNHFHLIASRDERVGLVEGEGISRKVVFAYHELPEVLKACLRQAAAPMFTEEIFTQPHLEEEE